jgi:hypothetical protein
MFFVLILFVKLGVTSSSLCVLIFCFVTFLFSVFFLHRHFSHSQSLSQSSFQDLKRSYDGRKDAQEGAPRKTDGGGNCV